MQKLKTHPQGPAFSRIIAGAWRWNVDTPQVESLIRKAIEYGITTFDHADIYGDYVIEELFGRVLKSNSSLRDKMELVTKCGIRLVSHKKPENRIKHYDTSKQHIINTVEGSLKNFHTDRIDLLLIHRPDTLMDPEEVAEAFGLLKQNGKVLHFGVSNFTTAQFEMLQSYLPFPLVTNQLELSLTKLNSFFDGTMDTLMKHRVCPMAWSPLGGGSHFDHADERTRRIALAAQDISTRYNHASVTQILLAWLLVHPAGIFPVIGTSKPERIQEAANSLSVQLDRQDWFEMLKRSTGSDVP